MEIRLPNLTQTLQISGCHVGTKPPGWSYPRHHHFMFELLYCREGEVRQAVGDDSFPLRAGQWLLIRTGVPHETSNLSPGPYGYFNLHFDIDDPTLRAALCRRPYLLLQQEEADAIGLVPQAEAIQRELLAHGFVVDIPAADLDEATASRELDPVKTAVGRLLVQSHTLDLVARFADFVSSSSSAGDTAMAAQPPDAAEDANTGKGPMKRTFGSTRANQATVGSATLAHAIEEKLRLGVSDGLTIADVAASLGISPGRCAQAFAEVYGESPRQYMSRLVLNEAKRLLVGTPLSIGEIAEKLQFESASHFSRQFRRWTGMPPSAFRPKHVR